MALFAVSGPNRSVIHRHVNLSVGGYSATTTSANATVAALLQAHVASMQRRLRAGQPINTWDPFYAAIFNASARGELKMSSSNISKGVAVTEVGGSPCAAAVLHEHATEVRCGDTPLTCTGIHSCLLVHGF
eukprot:COSAG05_NODE_345_length_10977_cov_17.229178_2_plen_131_part_00